MKQPFFATHWSTTSIARVLRPMQEFIQQEQSSGLILLAMTVIALLIANSPLAGGYAGLLDAKVGLVAGPFELRETVLHWINDGLMAIFFFLVGLEIKREILVGELSSPRAAALPIVAAIGGVLVPAGIYISLNLGGIGGRGWAVPMATDIAFALGCMALLGSRVPFGLKIFLTAVAIVDDLIAVLVIALFYSGGVNLAALGVGLAVLVALALANIFGIRSPLVYAMLGAVVWLAFLESGVHATIAGVLVALTIPARNRIDAPTFLNRARSILHHFEQSDEESTRMLTDEAQQSAVIELEEACEQVLAPLQKIEHSLHGWVSLLIMPVFALANAGVAVAPNSLGGESLPVVLGVVLGLTLGKPIGLLGACWLATRFGIADLPEGVMWRHMLGTGVLAGIGFTMSLFIAALAFDSPGNLAAAKLAILLASLVAGSAGLLLLRQAPRAEPKAA
ncbi:MAG: Na+/H+ antiporter NhaA [Kouleothrix sp.]|nr:Na+/H+ antiporter NhaA [Kouleothrix sp.]